MSSRICIGRPGHDILDDKRVRGIDKRTLMFYDERENILSPVTRGDKKMERPCKNCLFESINKEDLLKNIQEYIQGLSPEVRTEEGLYKKRIKRCNSCKNHLEGLCRICGCFIHTRAAKKQAYCPAVERFW